jgi:hypothetical protein
MGAHLRDQRKAVHVGHDPVADDEVEFRLLHAHEGGLGVRHVGDLGDAELAEGHLGETTHTVLIVDDKDGHVLGNGLGVSSYLGRSHNADRITSLSNEAASARLPFQMRTRRSLAVGMAAATFSIGSSIWWRERGSRFCMP